MQENQTFNDVVRQKPEICTKFQTMLHTRNTLRVAIGFEKPLIFRKLSITMNFEARYWKVQDQPRPTRGQNPKPIE